MDDLICACATSLGNGAINIIRISGNGSIELVDSLFSGNLLNKKSHTIHYGFIKNNDEILDEVLVSIFKAPKTYTKEDMVEINCHGSSISVEKIIKLLLKNGSRMADKGEFTKRAFLNGRIDLLEAEAVQNIITANSNASHEVALNGVKGNISLIIKNIRQSLINIVSNIEVNIDYPEYEDVKVITLEEIKEQIPQIKNTLIELLNNSLKGKVINNGIKIALVGKPNVGKSSLLNALMNEDKAIVTNIAGTTRDVVEGSIYLNNILINFIDTAGIRETDDIIEKIGIKKSKDAIDNADLSVLLLDYSDEISEEDKKIISDIDKNKLIIFVNKSDKLKKIDLNYLDQYRVVVGNTIDKNGLDELKKAIVEIFKLEEINKGNLNILTNINHISNIEKCIEILNDCLNNNNLPIDILEIDIKEVWQMLGELIGETYKEELLDEMFSRFCLGK